MTKRCRLRVVRPEVRRERVRALGLMAVLVLVAATLAACVSPSDGLTRKVVQALQAQAPSLPVTVKGPDDLEVPGPGAKPLKIALDNMRKACSAQPDRCDDQVGAFVARVIQVATGTGAHFSQDKVYPVLRTAGLARMVAQESQDPAAKLVVRPFAPGVELVLVLDGDATMRYVNRGDVAKAGIDEAALMAAALGNVANLPPLQARPLRSLPGFSYLMADDGLGTARAFDPALWTRLAQTIGGPVAMAMPTRDWIVITRADEPRQVATLRELAGRVVRREPYAMSDTVFVRDGAGWKPVSAH